MTTDHVAKIAGADTLLIALDFDGTLSYLVDEPMTARAIPQTRDAVAALAALPKTHVAYVSGRTVHDLKIISEYDDASGVLLAGSHGAEVYVPGESANVSGGADTSHAQQADELLTAARALADSVAGAWVEPKSFGFALHTRLSDPIDAERISDRVSELVTTHAPEWRVREGKDIREYAWRHEGKDTAIAWLREHTGATAVLFAGDDVTDEDAIRSLEPTDLGVRVGAGDTSAAVRVENPEALAELLAGVASLRASREQ